MKKILGVMLVVSLCSTPALAQNGGGGGGVMESGGNTGGYGMAGCGLGSILFGSKPGMVQILAATTNATFGSQTFGITTGTSNCTDGGGGLISARAFVETNRGAVAKDISRGSGETIRSLAALGGCADSAAVGTRLQASFKTIFPTAQVSDKTVSANVIGTLRADASLSCKKLQ